MAHYFGLRPWELDDLTFGEVDELMDRLRKAPPIGGVLQYEPAQKKKSTVTRR